MSVCIQYVLPETEGVLVFLSLQANAEVVPKFDVATVSHVAVHRYKLIEINPFVVKATSVISKL
jgi:hypothetical protein